MSDYKINVNSSLPKTLMPIKELTLYIGEHSTILTHIYQKKVGSVIYPTVITRPDIVCAASKLAEYLNNLGPEYLHTVDHYIQYLAATKYFAIKYSAINKQG